MRVHEEETKEEEKETGSPEVVASSGVRSKMDSESGGSAEDTSRSAERGLLKMQKQMACRVFISNLSHHYKEKFKTKVCVSVLSVSVPISLIVGDSRNVAATSLEQQYHY